jgi:hypothetical protein
MFRPKLLAIFRGLLNFLPFVAYASTYTVGILRVIKTVIIIIIIIIIIKIEFRVYEMIHNAK